MKRLFIVLAVALSLFACCWYVQRQQRIRHATQLLELQEVLQVENSAARHRNEDIVKNIEASVVKNQQQPREVAILQNCQALQVRTLALLDTLRILREELLRQTGKQALNRPKGTGSLVRLAQPVQLTASDHQKFARKFTAYESSLPVVPVSSIRVPLPLLNQQPAIVAGAMLVQTESALLAAQRNILLYFSHRVGAQKTEKKVVAVATAEANVVHPGETYRARLFLVKQLSWPHTAFAMQCNCQPVPVDRQGTGHVRFRASNQPGPASWQGVIRFNVNGRDTTFRVRVLYRVARR